MASSSALSASASSFLRMATFAFILAYASASPDSAAARSCSSSLRSCDLRSSTAVCASCMTVSSATYRVVPSASVTLT